MLYPLIQTQVSHWLTQPHCPAKPLLDYMVQAGKLRTPQIGAIATYLYLLFEGKNQDLASLWQQGLFSDTVDYSRAPISSVARTTFETQAAANTWYQWALKEHPQLAMHWATQADQFDFKQLTQQLFYNWTNTDYLFSLPMGAGKTWLMASIFYLNLYLHSQHPDDPRYARNFAILIPSSKKSSLLPSLRSIQRFKPEWVIPQPAAGLMAAQLKFEVLDAVKSAAKSNRTRNPNAQKLAQHAPFTGCTGLVLVVNAEKVILDKLADANAPLLTGVATASANELRDLIGSIPNLQIHIDEVQNAADDEIKLRRVVQGWHASGSIHSVLGYSGTPYHEKPHKITVSADGESQIKLPNISTVVYHYPLITAVEQFLKQPKVITLGGMQPAQIVAQGVQEFQAHYGSTVYETDEGTRLPAKLAIYCGSISRLETEIYPQLLASGIPAHEILRYHGGNKDHPVQAGAQAQFLALDTASSQVRFVLLVQIGKEGWDCKSLAGVILSQQGDCPTNMVLQTTCRCLREVKRGVKHSAHIWLNASNAQVLDAQLKATQQSSIAQLNAAANGTPSQTVQQVSRMAQLKLPPAVSALKLELIRHQIQLEPSPRSAEKLLAALNLALARQGTRSEDGFTSQGLGNQVNSVVKGHAGTPANFEGWLASLERQSFGLLSQAQLHAHQPQLQAIFAALCVAQDGAPIDPATSKAIFYDTTAPRAAVEQTVRLAFWQLGSLNYQLETIAPDAQLELLHAHKLKPLDAANVEALFPYLAQHDAILKADAQGSAANDPASELDAIKAQTIANLIAMGMPVPPELAAADTQAKSIAQRQKDRTLHYSPYAFEQSQFEKRFLEKALALDELANLGLELYYNGDRALTGFKIECFEQTPTGGWGKVGQYTPDFLLLKRGADNAVHQLMMIETKGAGFMTQTGYAARKRYVESSFLQRNAAHFGYPKFGFIELLEPPDAKERRDLSQLLHQLRQQIAQFFVNLPATPSANLNATPLV